MPLSNAAVVSQVLAALQLEKDAGLESKNAGLRHKNAGLETNITGLESKTSAST